MCEEYFFFYFYMLQFAIYHEIAEIYYSWVDLSFEEDDAQLIDSGSACSFLHHSGESTLQLYNYFLTDFCKFQLMERETRRKRKRKKLNSASVETACLVELLR